MLVYGESDAMDSETVTTKIGKELQPVVISEQIKYIYGDGNAIFHFESELKFEEMSIYCEILIEDFSDFMYVLIPFNGMLSSNAGDERIKHLLSIDDKPKKPNKNQIDFDLVDVEDGAVFDMFITMFSQGSKFENPVKEVEVCNMTLDELLDKMIDQGIDSLTEVEKQKLEQYSK
jgi:hypothetical protein